ncbi:MAG: S9 family peptidase [Steroidobacteraceae bacterium]
MKIAAQVLTSTVLFLSATVPVHAAETPPPRRPLTPDDFYNMQIVTDPHVSPDGKWVAYVVSTNDRGADEDRSAIWMVSWDGTQQIPLTNPAHDISSPRWSLDGRYLSYMAIPTGTDKSQIMLLDRRGGEARALTAVTDDIESYEWSPDSKRLVLVMEQGNPKPPSGTGEPGGRPPKPASNIPEATRQPPDTGKDSMTVDPAAGSADSTKKAADIPKPIVIDSMHFKEDKDGYLGVGHNRHVHLLDVETKKLEPLTTDPAFNEDLPAWSPDGRRIAFIRTREKGSDADGMEDIELIAAQPAAQPTKLLRIHAPNQQKLAWSPDGTTLAFLQGVEAKYAQYAQDRLAIVNASGGAPQILTDSLDRGVSSYAFNKDSAAFIVIIEDDGTGYPVLLNSRSHVVKKLTQGLSVVSDLSTVNGHTAVLSSNDSSPTEVYALEGDRLRRLTRHNDAFMAQLKIGAIEDMRFKSADGTPIHGLAVKPPDFQPGRKYPAVLWIHGGPNLQDDHSVAFDGYQFKRQVLAANGFVVFGVNYRGSSGRGDAFSRAIFADWGHKEVEDLLAGVDYLVRQGIADPEKLGIGGWSYGGMLTDYTIASDKRFKAALSGAGTANPLGMYAADQYYIQYNKELGDPWTSSDLYLKLAYPLLHADRIHTPTLFMGGDKDFNVPIVGGEQMYLALRTLGVPAQLIVYPGQYHTLTRPSFLKDRAERAAAWFNQYLLSSAR